MATHGQFSHIRLEKRVRMSPVRAGCCDGSRDIVSLLQGTMWVRGQGQKDIFKIYLPDELLRTANTSPQCEQWMDTFKLSYLLEGHQLFCQIRLCRDSQTYDMSIGQVRLSNRRRDRLQSHEGAQGTTYRDNRRLAFL